MPAVGTGGKNCPKHKSRQTYLLCYHYKINKKWRQELNTYTNLAILIKCLNLVSIYKSSLDQCGCTHTPIYAYEIQTPDH